MSAPPSASANGSPGPGYYPDPSIPGYIRYWNGAAWVPGTSRPEPREGEPVPAAPPGVAAQAPGAPPAPGSRAPAESPQEETGPVFLDEEEGADAGSRAGVPAPAPGDSLPQLRGRGEVEIRPGERAAAWRDPSRPHGGPEPASAWQADAARQAGLDGERDGRVSWGTGVPGGPSEGAAAPALGAGRAPQALGPGPVPDPRGGPGHADGAGPVDGGNAQPRDDGTVRMRPVRPEGTAPAAGGRPVRPGDTVGLRRTQASGAGAAPVPAPGASSAPVPAAPAPASPAPVPADPAGPAAPVTPAGPASGQPSWTRQVHELAQRAPASGGPAPAPHASAPHASAPAVPQQQSQAGRPGGAPEQVVPWRPPVDDPFLRAAQRQARPAGLGRRLGARLVDGVLTAAVAAAVALPFAGPSTEHFREQVEAAEQAGETRQIWLVDGTTGVYLAIVLGALLVFGLLYEVLPTARWGRTLGKKLFGVRVLDIEEQEAPSFGAALRRWLVYGLLAPLGVGVVNVLWCLFDRPWRQCWHDKAARTFVARGTEESGPPG
ncbi:RDD family protein [Streptomyces verrucosisporus]|uniref:RDD family protein n=1 Tax=Streptomyces verrucosisporus TaxID=1695161 RepID=UPI0019CF7809|nr:RDD family protein [Streptomyces verrucosisporus]MBN3930295.1 RDD family protein [Streptomyces verrucosisporus]